MSDIVFLNLERQDDEFLACVRNEQHSLKSIIRNLPIAERPSLKLIDAYNPTTIHNGIVSASRILHISGHGQYFGNILASTPTKGSKTYSLQTFCDHLVEQNEYLDLDCVVLDSCYSAGRPWLKQLNRIVGPSRKLVVIGSSFALPFSQAETFFDHFYSRLLQRRLPLSRPGLRTRIYDSFNAAQLKYITENWRFSRLRITTLGK